MKLKTIITEFAILLAVLIFTWLIIFWFAPVQNIINPHIEINKHENWFVFDWYIVIIPPFLMLIVLVYFIKEAFNRYHRKLQNIILVCANFIFILFLSRVFLFVDVLKVEGGTVYPPLSALPKAHEPLLTNSDGLRFDYIVFVLFIVFMLILVISAVFIGKNWKTKTHEPAV